MKTPHQTLVPSALEARPHPSDQEIYHKPVSTARYDRPLGEEASKESNP